MDYPGFSSDTCKHNVYYFFADLAGFIAAQILDPAMYLGGIAITKIAGKIKKVLNGADVIDDVSDAAKMAKAAGKLENAGHGSGLVKKVVDDVGDASKWTDNSGDFFNFMDGYCDAAKRIGSKVDDIDYNALRVVGKGGDKVDWTADRIKSLQKLADTNPQLFNKIDNLADVPGIEKRVHILVRTQEGWLDGVLGGRLSKGIQYEIDTAAKLADDGAELVGIGAKTFTVKGLGKYTPDMLYKKGGVLKARECKTIMEGADTLKDSSRLRKQLRKLDGLIDETTKSGKIKNIELVVKCQDGNIPKLSEKLKMFINPLSAFPTPFSSAQPAAFVPSRVQRQAPPARRASPVRSLLSIPCAGLSAQGGSG